MQRLKHVPSEVRPLDSVPTLIIDCVTLHKSHELFVPLHHLQHAEDGTTPPACSEESAEPNTYGPHQVWHCKAGWLFLEAMLTPMPTYDLSCI